MQEQRQIQIANYLAGVLSLLMLSWALIVFIIEQEWTIPLWDLSLAMGLALVPWINRRHSRFGRVFLIVLTNATIFLFPALFGENSGTHYCFLPATTLPFALFGSNQRSLLAFGVLLPMGLFCLLVGTDFSLFPRYAEIPEKSWIFWLTILSAFILSFFPIFFFSKSNEKAERELRASERKYSQIVELAQEGIWVVTNGGRIQYANRAMADMLQVEL